jgi:hypothetical protein
MMVGNHYNGGMGKGIYINLHHNAKDKIKIGGTLIMWVKLRIGKQGSLDDPVAE